MDFVDRKTRKPIKAWGMLLLLAKHSGIIGKGKWTNKQWSLIAKRVEEINGRFKQLFGIQENPIHYVSRNGYVARFKISGNPLEL